MSGGGHGNSFAARRRLKARGHLLAAIAAVLFTATWIGYRQWRDAGSDAATIATLAETAAEVASVDKELPRHLRELAAQARQVAAGEHPFAAPPVEQLEPVMGPDGKLIQPDDPRYAMVAGTEKPEPDAVKGVADTDDLSDMPAEVALARVTLSMVGRLQSYASWLVDTANESEERLEQGERKDEEGEGEEGENGPKKAVPAESGAEAGGGDAQAPAAEEVRQRIAEYRERSVAISRVAADLESSATPLADPAAWERELTLYASLFALLAAALPLGWGAVCYHLARLRGRERSVMPGVPAARARAWRQERDLQYNGYSAYLLHVLLIALPFLGFHCAYDLGPPGGGGGEVGEENPEQQVQVVEVIRRKLIVNPFSPISLDVPDEVEIDVKEVTERLATAAKAGGEGAGEGGYEGGAGTAFVFVAINHGGRHWDEATKSSAAAKFLAYFGGRTGVRTKPRPMELSVGNLMAQDDDDQQPAMIYLSIAGSAPRFSSKEMRFLHRYVEDVGGVILIDALGSGAKRHADAIARGVTGTASWRVIGRDDPLMSSRESLSGYSDKQLALAGHDGRNLLGIRASDGYWGIIYHPGDLVDAWRGAYDSEWQDTGFKIGTNIADYAMKRFTRRRRGSK